MKELYQDEMNNVSGAGAGEIDWYQAINYTNYENFGDYLQFMQDHGMKALGLIDVQTQLPVRGLMPTFNKWCMSQGLSPEEVAKNYQ